LPRRSFGGVTADRSRTQIAAWIAAGIVLLVVAWKLLAAPAGSAGGAAVSVSRPAEARSSPSGRAVYVHVAGRVARPGLYRLPPGSRVATAIDRAGGPARGAELSAVNLAMRVQDGQQVLVPRRGAPATAAAAGGDGAGGARLSLATATVEQLDQLDGIGPTLAKRIVDYREQHGGFRSLDELKQVEGIGDKRFAALKDSLGP
jgi:competence protein ComEA